MRVLMVVAHPCEDSFARALAQRATIGLERSGHHVDVLDLYRLDGGEYDPVMHADEWRDYMSPHDNDNDNGNDNVNGNGLQDDVVRRHGELVADAEALVFVYPTWWSSVPAMLKGWFERTLRPGVAFEIDHRGHLRAALPRLAHLVGISTYGSSRWYVRLINDNGRRLITRTVRLVARRRPTITWLGLYSIDTADDTTRATFLDMVERRLARLGGVAR